MKFVFTGCLHKQSADAIPKPPQLVTDEELVDRILGCKQRSPESDSLDYKSILNLETPAQTDRTCKDSSLFANEFGGTLLYGVPEVKENDVMIPVSLEKCGLKITGRIPETVENILLDSVRPVLPNLFVKPIAILAVMRSRS